MSRRYLVIGERSQYLGDAKLLAATHSKFCARWVAWWFAWQHPLALVWVCRLDMIDGGLAALKKMRLHGGRLDDGSSGGGFA